MEWWKEYNVKKLLDEFGMQNWFLNPLNISHLIQEKGAKIEINENSVAIESDGRRVLFPTNKNIKGYIEDIIKYKSVKNIRNIDYLKKVGKLFPFQTEYIIDTEEMVNNVQSKTRQRINKINKSGGQLVELNEGLKEKFKECNAEWYRNQQKMGDKFRLYGKRTIEWIIDNYEYLKEEFGCCAKGLVIDDRVCSFFVCCDLSEEYGCNYTIRYVNGKGYSDYAMIYQAKQFEGRCKYINDGTADTKGIKEHKLHFSKFTKKTYGFDLN